MAVAKRKDKPLNGIGSVHIDLIPLMMIGPFCTQTTPTFAQLTAAEGTWLEATVVCNPPMDGNLKDGTLRIGAYGLTTEGDQLIFDNVRVTIESSG